jgi:hypothetical protein
VRELVGQEGDVLHVAAERDALELLNGRLSGAPAEAAASREVKSSP